MKKTIYCISALFLSVVERGAQAESVIGGADKPTQIVVASSLWQQPSVWAAVLLVCGAIYLLWKRKSK